MGAGNSGLFHGTKGSKSQIDNNIAEMERCFPVVFGYFGQKGEHHRVIKSTDQYKTADKFFQMISKGANIFPLQNGKGIQAIFPGGTRIVYRVITKTPNSPAVDITIDNSTKIKTQKIHFILEE